MFLVKSLSELYDSPFSSFKMSYLITINSRKINGEHSFIFANKFDGLTPWKFFSEF